MGLFTAYHASERVGRVVVLERGRIGDPMTASFGRTRSFRNDYLDPTYARLAHEAFRLWGAFELQTATRALVRCGCLNVAKRSVTPDLADTYAQRSHETLASIGLRTESFDRDALRERFGFLDADIGRLDVDAGIVDLPAVTGALMAALSARGVRVLEGVATLGVERDGDRLRVSTDGPELSTRSLVVTAGHGTNEVLSRLPDCHLEVPLARDRPSEAKYFVPPASARERFTAGAMPVIAYLDTGIYCHPIVDGLVEAVKIGYYNPPDMPRSSTAIDSIESFVEQCAPGLRDADVAMSRTSTSATTTSSPTTTSCSAPSRAWTNAFVGVGWRGTGYKFAPVGGPRARRAGAPGRHRLRHRPLRSGPIPRRREDAMRVRRRGPCSSVSLTASSSAPRATSSSSSAAATSRPARSSPRSSSTSPTRCAAAPRVHARRLRRDGRADLLRAPRQAQGRRARAATWRR